MVKDECDIVRDWVLYHGNIFGYENLYVIDNYSTDGTYEILKGLSDGLPIHLYQEKDYAQKGAFMSKLIRETCGSERFAIPLDIDEFITKYDRQTNTISCQGIKEYIESLPYYPAYKFEVFFSKIYKEGGYENAVRECPEAQYSPFGKDAKTFFNVEHTKHINIDHGNHGGYHHHYMVTDLAMIHYHFRNNEQIKKKTLNNLVGLGYPNDLETLKDLFKRDPGRIGFHHMMVQIKILEGNYSLRVNSKKPGCISLKPLIDYVKEL